MKHSVFIKYFDDKGKSHARYEHHDLSYNDAMSLSMGHLYKKGMLVGGVQILIRTKKEVVYTATNPLPKDSKFLYPKNILDAMPKQ